MDVNTKKKLKAWGMLVDALFSTALILATLVLTLVAASHNAWPEAIFWLILTISLRNDNRRRWELDK